MCSYGKDVLHLFFNLQYTLNREICESTLGKEDHSFGKSSARGNMTVKLLGEKVSVHKCHQTRNGGGRP